MTRAIPLIVLLLAATGVGAAEHVETIDADLLSGLIISIDDKALVLRAGGKERSVPLRRIVSATLDRAAHADRKVAQGLLVTHRGDAIPLAAPRLDKGRFSFTNALLGRTQIALGDVEVVFLPGKGETALDIRRQCDKMKIVPTSQDIMVVDKDGKLLPIKGVLKRIGAESGSPEIKVSFRWQDTDRTISLAGVRAIVLAKAPVAGATAAGTLTGRDGTQVAFTDLALTGQTCKIKTPAAGDKTIPRRAVATIRFVTTGADSLSALRPTAVKEYGFFDRTFGHRLNMSVSGSPLKLDGREYRTGLGLHSFCELTYALNGKYVRLVTVAGIDDTVRPAGDAEVAFFGDGRPLGKPTRLRGKDRGTVLRVDLTGVKELKVRVGFGSDGLDVADHVDLAAARLIKPAT